MKVMLFDASDVQMGYHRCPCWTNESAIRNESPVTEVILRYYHYDSILLLQEWEGKCSAVQGQMIFIQICGSVEYSIKRNCRLMSCI